MKQIMILLLAAAIGSAVQAGNRTDTSLFMKEDSSVMQMISAGVPYKDRKVDILVRVTVKSGERFAEIEAEVLSGGPVLVRRLVRFTGSLTLPNNHEQTIHHPQCNRARVRHYRLIGR